MTILFLYLMKNSMNEIPIVSAHEALKSLENVKTYLIQQEGASSYLKAVNSLEKFIREKRVIR